MKKGLCISLSALSVFFLSSMTQAQPSAKSTAYVDLGLGQALTYHADSGSFTPSNPTAPMFSLHPKNSGLPQSLMIGGGWLWPQMYGADSPYFPFVSLGLYYQHTNLLDTKKPVILEISDSTNDNLFTSDYVFSQDSLMAYLKTDIYRWQHVMPYLSIGLGASWNQVKQKQPFLVDLASIIANSQRTTAFSYNIGAGLDFPVTEKFWLGLGYNYSNFGRVQAGDLCLSEGIGCTNAFGNLDHFGNLTTQTILLTGRYVFA